MGEEASGVGPERKVRYVPTAATGVAGRASDNTLVKVVLGWEPTTGLRDGLAETYGWIRDQIVARATLGAR